MIICWDALLLDFLSAVGQCVLQTPDVASCAWLINICVEFLFGNSSHRVRYLLFRLNRSVVLERERDLLNDEMF